MKPPRFDTFGCRLNSYETEAMQDMARDAGLKDALVINTCAVTSEAVRQARQHIRRMRRENPQAKLVVTGCAAQTDPASFADMVEVDLVVGNTEKLKRQTWDDIARGKAAALDVGDIMAERTAQAPLVDGLGARARAYVQVQTGCDHRCTFCIIPFGRGNSRSVPETRVVEQVRRLVDRGFREIVLTGVDLTSWGADLEDTPKLGQLVRKVLDNTPDLPRLRLSSIDSIEVDPALMEAITGDARLMPHLHLSLQHGDNMILKRMKRRHLREDAITFCQNVRAARPDMVFGADIITGFPTETETMFENSLRLIEECELTWLHVFPFSPRTGTPAARMPQVPGDIGKARAARLREAGKFRVERHLDQMIGKTVRLLMEKPDRGRTEGFAMTEISGAYRPGEIVPATIVNHRDGVLIADAV